MSDAAFTRPAFSCSNQQMIESLQAIGLGAALVDPATRTILAGNDLFAAITGCTPGTFGDLHWAGPAPEEDKISTYQQNWLQPHSAVCRAQVRVASAIDEDGRDVWFVVLEDITRAHAAEALQKQEHERMASALSSAGLATWDWDIPSGEVRYNDRWAELRGYRLEELAPHLSTWEKLVHPDDRASVMAAIEAHSRGETEHYVAEHRTRTKTGEWRWVDGRGKVVARDSAGRPLRMTGTELDITARKEVEHALIDSERRLGTLIAHLPGMVYRCKNLPNWPVEFVSRGALQLTGFHPHELQTLPQGYNSLIHPDDQARVWNETQTALECRESFRMEYRIRDRSGGGKWVWEQGGGIFDEHGALVALEGFVTDITQRKQAAAEAMMWRARYDAASLSSGQVLYDWCPAENTVSFGGALTKILGYDAKELDGELQRWLAIVHPDDRDGVSAACALAESARSDLHLCYRLRRKDGSYLPVEDMGRFFAIGGVARMIGFIRDVSERERADQVRLRLEEQLRQSQKLEAIGQLSGGIAHDFNNILTIVQGHVGFLELEPLLTPDGRKSVQEIGRSATRAANLTSQLLTFSRRNAMQLASLDLNGVVANVVGMLQRLLGEPIRFRVVYGNDALPVRADAVMLEQVLINLAVNARDAMPDGGTLTIETAARRIEPRDLEAMPQGRAGPVVVLRVTDTGQGIPPDALPHIFEPFFTTKDIGKGTGLGLATVHGIVHQHQGWIAVQTAVGKGTTFSVFLPRATPPAAPNREASPAAPSHGHGEALLLVEDEEAVRIMLTAFLQKHGFKVFAAGSGPEALRVWNVNAADIRVVITDLVMPDGMSGRVLAERLLALNPQLGVIYMSGYSAEIASGQMQLEPGVNFIAKPLDLPRLIPAIHAALQKNATRPG